MNQATIVSYTPTGEPPYQSQHGPLYSFRVVFDNNTDGVCNSKKQEGSFRVGDVVTYEVTGNFKGVSKLKLNRPDGTFQPTPRAQPMHQAQAASTGIQVAEPITPVFGATVGMSLNLAMATLNQGLGHDEIVERIAAPGFYKSVHEVASDLIRVARELEAGRLAPSPTERSKRFTAAKTAPAVAPEVEDVPF